MSILPTLFHPLEIISSSPFVEVQSCDNSNIDNVRSTTDIWDVKEVPTEFESVSKPSEVVEQLLEKKERMCRETLRGMEDKLDEIQDQCADEMRNSCVSMKKYMEDIRKEISKAQGKFEDDLARYSDEGCRTVKIILKSHLDRETNAIDEFRLKLQDIERERIERVTEIILNYQESLRKIGCSSLESSTILTCDKIREFNRILLRNHRIYEKLIFNLASHTDEVQEKLNTWLERIRIWHPKP